MSYLNEIVTEQYLHHNLTYALYKSLIYKDFAQI